MNLYFDIGNTNIKLNFKINDSEHYVSYKTDAKYTVDTLYQSLPNEIKNSKTIVSNIYVCSVVPEKSSLIEGLAKKYYSKKAFMIGHRLKTGIQIKSNDPHSVGGDLIALSAFLNARDKDKTIIVNMGTATTIVLAESGSFEGVIIAPGIMESLHSLINNASKLNQIVLMPTTKKIGKNTQDAISIGVLSGHAEMIRSLVAKLDAKTVYISGGYSKMVLELLPEYEYVKEATIQGMKEIARLNDK